MADLSTNYLDDILAQSMNGKRKYRITRADGTFEEVTLEDVSEYEQVGSNFGAGDINKTNQAVNEKFDSGDVVDPMLTTEPGFAADAYQTKLQFDEQNKNLGGLRFGVDGDGNYGYYGADDSLIPFKRGVATATLLKEICTTTSTSETYTFSEDCDLCVAMISSSNNKGDAYDVLDVTSSTAEEIIRFDKNALSGLLSNPVKLVVLKNLKKGDKITMTWFLYGVGAIIKLS